MTLKVANKLYELRKQNKMSQEELAEKLGVSRQAVSKWERAEASPTTDSLILLAQLYNISLDELLEINQKQGHACSKYYDQLIIFFPLILIKKHKIKNCNCYK